MSFKNYLFSLKFFVIFSIFTFTAAIVAGYFSAKAMPEQIEELSEPLEELASFIFKLDPILQVVFIFLNNAFKGFLAMTFGVLFGVFPFFILFFNGEMVGMMAFVSKESISLSQFILLLLPHGIFEITAFIFACAVGMRIGKAAFLKVFFKKGEVKKEFLKGIKFFLKYLVPLFAIAAIVEIFITPRS